MTPPRDQLQEMEDTLTYLKAHALKGTTPPEGSLSAVIRARSPQEQAVLVPALRRAIAAERANGLADKQYLFQPDQERQRMAEPDEGLKAVMSTLQHEDVVDGLHRRLGTPTAGAQADLSDTKPAPTLRDALEQALDQGDRP